MRMTILATLALILLALGAYFGNLSSHFGVAAAPQPTDACSLDRSVQVSGQATVNVRPDRVRIQLAVVTNNADAKVAVSENAATIQAVIQAIRSAANIDTKDIATDQYGVRPIYQYNPDKLTGYQANNALAITLCDVSKTGPVLLAALQAGANEVTNVEFYTSQLRQYRDQARNLAVQAAQEKASALAQAAGAATSCVLSISEDTSSYYNSWWNQSAQIWAQNVTQNIPAAPGSESAGEGPITLGEIAIRAEVHLTYGLK